MLLHIINKSPLKYSVLADALPYINKNDTVLFIDDGVYACITDSQQTKQLINKQCTIVALIDDINTRGLDIEKITMKPIDMNEFVHLVFQSSKSVSWY